MTKRLLPLLLLLLGVSSWSAGTPEEKLNIVHFGGLNTESPEASLQDNETPDSENVVSDLGAGLRPRDGFTLCQASSATAQWVFPHSNGTRYQIIQSGGVLKADTGSCSFSITISTVDSAVNVAAAVLGDKFFFMDTTNGLKYWDTASVTLASSTLKGTQLVNHKSRLWASGLSADPRSIRASAFNDGTSWSLVTDPVVTDPAIFVIGGAVDEPMTTLYSSHLGALIWMRPRSFGAVSGDSRADFAVRTYSDNVGTAYPDSVRDCDGLLRWLGPSRTIYEWDGAKLSNIGVNIQTYLGQIGQGDANSRTYNITLKADYDTGTAYQKTSAISSGDLELSTWTATDTSASDFGAGTVSNTSVIGGSVYLSTNSADLVNNSFESGTGTDADNWTETGYVRISTLAQSGTYSMQVTGAGGTTGTPAVYTGEILDASGSLISFFGELVDFQTIADSSTTWAQESVNLSAYAGRWIKVRFGGGLTSDVFLCNGGTMTWYDRFSYNGTKSREILDNFQGGRSTTYSGTFTSQTFDTALTSSAWTPSGTVDAVNGSSVSYQTQSSSDGTNWQTAVAWSTGSAPASDFRRYIRYVVTLSTGGTTNGTALPRVDSVTLASRANYGAYISTAISLGSISSFGLFTANTASDGGTVGYAVYSDSNTSMTITNGIPTAGFVSSQTVTASSYVTLSTNAYIRMGETETITISTNNPTNHSLSVAWSEGNTTKVPSTWFRQRYWLGVSQNSTTNNKVLVFDRNRQWQRYSGINASALGIYNGALFFGNSAGVYQYESGTTDNGTAIASYYRTPTFSPSSANLASTFLDLRVTAESSSETLATTYRINSVSTDYSFGSYAMNTASGLQNFKLPFPITQINKGRNISFNLAVSGTTMWRILGLTLNFVPDRVPLD